MFSIIAPGVGQSSLGLGALNADGDGSDHVANQLVIGAISIRTHCFLLGETKYL